jgi:hypothetical protein
MWNTPTEPLPALRPRRLVSIDTRRVHRVTSRTSPPPSGAGSRQLEAYATGGVLVPSEHHIGLLHEWVTRQIDTPVGHA